MQHTFFVHSFDVVLHNYMYNVKLPTCRYTSCIGKVVFARFFFSLPLIFTLLAATCIISHFLTTNFHGFFCYFLPLPMPVVRTGMHNYGHIITKISRIHIEPNFGGAEEPEQWTDDKHLIFSPPLTLRFALVSHKMPCSPCVAHKAPVMQATYIV